MHSHALTIAAFFAAVAVADVTLGAIDCNYGGAASRTGALDNINYLQDGSRCDFSFTTNQQVACEFSSIVQLFSPSGNFDSIICEDVGIAASAILGHCSSTGDATVHGQVSVNGGNDAGGLFVQIDSQSGPCVPQ